MKTFYSYSFVRLSLVLVLSLLLHGCGGKEEGSASSSPASSSSSSSASMDLGRAFYEANQELRKYAAQKGLMEDPRIAESDQAAYKAYQDFTALRRSHPELKGYYEKSDEMLSKATQSKIGGDEEAYNQAMSEFKSIRMELERKSVNLPEVLEAKKKMEQISEDQTFIICDVVAETGAEGKKLADKARSLLEKLQAQKI